MKNGIRNLVGLLKVNVIYSAQSSRLYDVEDLENKRNGERRNKILGW
jgi:hypothetical protein